MKDRVEYFDFLRGVAILMVVAIHTFNSCTNLDIAIRQIFNVAVPLFLAISGFFLANKDVCTRNKYISFLKKQVVRVYIPCLIWSLPLFVLGLKHGNSIVNNIILWVVCGFSIYYFIALVIQYYILLPIMLRMVKPGYMILMSCVSVICISYLTYIMQIRGVKLPLIIYAGGFPLWIVFFFLGVYLRKTSNRDYPVLIWGLLTVIFFIFSYYESKLLISYGGSGVGVKLSSFCFSFTCILVLFSRKAECLARKTGWLYRTGVFIGGISFGMYLIHCHFIHICTMTISDFNSISWGGKWLMITVVTILFIIVIRYILPRITYILGFK